MRILRIALWSMVALFVGVAAAVKFFGLRLDLAGSGMPTIVEFRPEGPAAHQSKLEQERQAPPPAPLEPPVVRAAAPERHWADFRGPGRNGIYTEGPILTTWPAGGFKPLWKQRVGGGWAGFVVADGAIFTIEQRRDNEVVAAYDAATGRERWTNSWAAHFDESMGGDGPRATPVVDEGRVYALGAEGELRCLEAATGKLVWNKNILKENGAANITWAVSHSPLVVDGMLVVLPGGGKGRSVVAYDKLTGKFLWGSQDDEQSYTSPMLVTLGGKRQLLVVSALRAMGLTVEDGKLLWDYPWTTEYNINSAQPIVTHPNRFLISAGYGHGSALVELKPDGDKFAATTVWQNTKMKAKFNSLVLHEGHAYGLDEGILACIKVDTGEQMWKGGRYGYGQLVLASGHLVVLTETGELKLVRATPEKLVEVAGFSAIDGKTWGHPAISRGVVYVRNTREMAAYRIASRAE